jgi:hypothetical protein
LPPDSKFPVSPRDRRSQWQILAAALRREKLIRESLMVRYRFNLLVATELREGRWVARGFSPQDATASRSVRRHMWETAELEFDLLNNCILRAGAPWLVGVQVRPRRQQPDGPGKEPELSPSDLKLLAKLEKYAEQESRKHDGSKVKEEDLVEYAKHLGVSYRKGRALSRHLPAQLIHAARRRSK